MLKDAAITHLTDVEKLVFNDRGDHLRTEAAVIQCQPCPLHSLYSHLPRTNKNHCQCPEASMVIENGECRNPQVIELPLPVFSHPSGSVDFGTVVTVSFDPSTVSDCYLSIVFDFGNLQTSQIDIFNFTYSFIVNSNQTVTALTKKSGAAASNSVNVHYWVKLQIITPYFIPSGENQLYSHPISVIPFTPTPNCSLYVSFNDQAVTPNTAQFVFSFFFDVW